MITRLLNAIINGIEFCIQSIIRGVEVFANGFADLLVLFVDYTRDRIRIIKDALIKVFLRLSSLLGSMLQLLILLFPFYSPYIWGREISSVVLMWIGGGLTVVIIIGFLFGIGTYITRSKSAQQGRPHSTTYTTGSPRKRKILTAIFCVIDVLILAFCVSSVLKEQPPKSMFLKVLKSILVFDWNQFFENTIIVAIVFTRAFTISNIWALLFILVTFALLMILVWWLKKP